MPKETIGDTVQVMTAGHPARTDSPEYLRSRKWLMKTPGGCLICGGVVDLSHPEAAGDSKGMQDHHGGAIYFKGIAVARNLFPLEWSQGWGASPKRVAELITQLNEVLTALGEETYSADVSSVTDVMGWVDSVHNANIRYCAPHHVGHQTQHTPDVNGHEAVGAHNIPEPIFWGQMTCDWDVFDMWGGTTGTLAVAAPRVDGSVMVLHADPIAHPDIHEEKKQAAARGQALYLPKDHPHAEAARAPALASDS